MTASLLQLYMATTGKVKLHSDVFSEIKVKKTINDTHREKRMTGWLLLTFFICIHNQSNSTIHSITRIKSTDVWKM